MNLVMAFLFLTVNITHGFLYTRLSTRNPLRFLAVYLGCPLLMCAGLWLGKMLPLANGVFMPVFLIGCAWLIRLVTNDSYGRVFFCMASVLATALVVRTPPFLLAAYGLGRPMEESVRFAFFTYPVLLLLLAPLILRYVRKPFMRILDIAETQKWYLVCLPPFLFTSIGDIIHIPAEGMTDAFKLQSIAALMPLIIVAYFISLHLFLVSHRDRQLLAQRLAAAERLEGIYVFYDRQLSEKESRLQRVRHDFRHLVVHLRELARERDWNGILGELETVSAAGGQTAVMLLCENRTVNAVVSAYFARAEERGVRCAAKAFVPEQLAISKADLSMLLGNALENCVKAATPLGEAGYIRFDAKPAKGCMHFEFSNNYAPDAYAKGSGVGLASIRHVCEQHDGRMEASDENGEFRLTLFLQVL